MRLKALLLTLCLLSLPLLAMADEAADLRKQIILDQKRLHIMENLALEEQEAEKFWPAYRDFQNKLFAVELDRSELLGFYVSNYKSLSDQQATDMIDAMFLLTETRQALLKEFSLALRMDDILSARKTFRYLQIEQNIAAVEEYGLAKKIPLLQ